MDRHANHGCEYERLPSDDGETDRGYDDDGDEEDLNDVGGNEDDEGRRRPPVETGQKFAYGLGHVFNDIAATIWFSYTMVFMQNVVGMPPTMAGFLLFFGWYNIFCNYLLSVIHRYRLFIEKPETNLLINGPQLFFDFFSESMVLFIPIITNLLRFCGGRT